MNPKGTLRNLRPVDAVDPEGIGTKNTPVHHGSFFLKMRKPDRFPAFSRQYMPGDPPRLIDWKVFARTDQAIVREKRDNARANVVIGIDWSDTMNWPVPSMELANATPTKREIATRLALNLCYFHLKSGDRVNIVLTKNAAGAQGMQKLIASSSSDVLQIFEHLTKNAFDLEHTGFVQAFDPLRLGRPDMVYFLSDALNDNLPAFFSTSRRKIFIHILSSLEDEIEWTQDEICYFDYERDRKEYLGSALKHNGFYKSELEKWKHKLTGSLRKVGSDYVFLTDNSPISYFHKVVTFYLEAG
ncbi:MAG: DUF58 domain-containing protein [Oligoflexales bacterium]